MRFLILHHGDPWQSLAATSLIKGLSKRYPDCSLSWATSSESYPLYQFNQRLENIFVGKGPFKDKYDVTINLTPTEECARAMQETEAAERRGFVLQDSCLTTSEKSNDEFLPVLLGEASSSKNILQIYFRLAGMRWKGDGYDMSYYPRNKMKKSKTGIAVSDDSLRTFVKENLELDYSELWHVPLRSNLLKRIDEINRVKHLITDDLFCVHAGIAMRKHVEFLDTQNLNMSIEFFSKGNHHRIGHELK